MDFPLPLNEADRLGYLRKLDLVRSPPDPGLDALVELAARSFDMPMAFVSLLDDQRQWFKARCGFDLGSTRREYALCNHAIAGGDVLVVEDAARDPRFCDNVLVSGPFGLRFYAGCPISADGEHLLGSLCLIDTRPRAFGAEEVARLRGFGAMVDSMLRTYRHALEVREGLEQIKALTSDLADRQSLLEQVEEMTEVGGWTLTRDGQMAWSDQVYRIHELPVGAMPDFETAVAFFPPEAQATVANAIDRAFTHGERFRHEVDFITARGRPRRVRSTGERVTGADGVVKVVGIFQDVTEQSDYEQRLWNAAHLDSLTGLPNRLRFTALFGEQIEAARAREGTAGLMLVNLDTFKQINDLLGHDAGDQVLRQIGGRIARAVGPGNVAARFGSDEFAVSLPSADEAAVAACADRLLKAMARPMTIGSHKVSVTASIGCARYPHDAATTEDLVKCADIALFSVKRSGRGSFGFFGPQLQSGYLERVEAVRRVRRAAAEGRILPFFQKTVDLSTGRRRGFEALVRIEENGRIVTPGEFWPAFFDPECARLIGEHMLEQTIATLVGWRAAGFEPGIVGINISEFSIHSERFATEVLSRLTEAGIAPSQLMLEITETVILSENDQTVLDNLRVLKAAGCKIALDDFGTGYASLSHLRDYPIDIVKIDKSFLSDLATRPDNEIIVKAIVDLAHNLDLMVIAEGVEHAYEAQFLTLIGADEGQGFLFGRPAPASEVMAREGETARALTA